MGGKIKKRWFQCTVMKEFPNCLTNLRLGTDSNLLETDNLSVFVTHSTAERFWKHDSVDISPLMYVGTPIAM